MSLELRCRGLDGTAYSVEVQHCWNIADVLNSFEVSLGIPASEVRLVDGASPLHARQLVGEFWRPEVELTLVRLTARESTKERQSRMLSHPRYVPLPLHQKRTDPLRCALLRVKVNQDALRGFVDAALVDSLTDERWYTVQFSDGTRWLMHEGSVERMQQPDDEEVRRARCKLLDEGRSDELAALLEESQAPDGPWPKYREQHLFETSVYIGVLLVLSVLLIVTLAFSSLAFSTAALLDDAAALLDDT